MTGPESMVTVRTPHGEMPTFLAVPSGEGPWPGVIVLHDFTGMSHDLQHQAEWLAGEGFLAAAPDLYYWGSRVRADDGQPGSGRCHHDVAPNLECATFRVPLDYDRPRGPKISLARPVATG